MLAWSRRHALFLGAFVLGVVLRVLVTVGYTPALIFPDTREYVADASSLGLNPVRPSGYSLFLRPFLQVTHWLAPVEVAQHVIVLVVVALCYAFLLRRGLPRWGAALAVLPLLLDPLQLVLEGYVLSDVLFEVLLVGACLLVLWRHRPGPGALAVAGLLVGCAAFVRGAGEALLVVFLVALVCLRLPWARLAVFLVAALVPIAAYMSAFHAVHGQYAIATSGPRFLYGRLALIVHCKDPGLRLPSYEQALCPVHPVGQRRPPSWFLWNRQHSPQWLVQGPAGTSQVEVVKDFDRRVVRAQPGRYATATLTAAVRGFAPVRTHSVPGHPASSWLFADHYWTVDTFIQRHLLSPRIRAGTGYDPGVAGFLTSYRTWVYTPGPLMVALLLAAVAAVLGLGRSRRSGNRVAIGLLVGSCAVPLLTAAALSGFSWRYQLPQIPFLPLAGALGLAALLRGRSPETPDRPPGLLDRACGRVLDLPVPATWRAVLRRADRRGWLPAALAVLAGAVVAVVCGLLVVASGWVLPATATVLALVVGALVVVVLLVARVRADGEVTRTGRTDRPG